MLLPTRKGIYMIILNFHDFKNFNQETYDSRVKEMDANIHSMPCPCCKEKDSLVRHGCYTRFFRSENDPDGVPIRIQRYRCTECYHTQAILPSFMIPYFHILLFDVLDILRAESKKDLLSILEKLNIDFRIVRFIKNRFHKEWENLESKWDFSHLISLTRHCISKFNKQFLQPFFHTRIYILSYLDT